MQPEVPISEELKVKIKEVVDIFNQTLKERNLKMAVAIDFPIYKELPPDAQLAMLVLEKHGATFKMTFKEIKLEEEKPEETQPVVDKKEEGGTENEIK